MKMRMMLLLPILAVLVLLFAFRKKTIEINWLHQQAKTAVSAPPISDTADMMITDVVLEKVSNMQEGPLDLKREYRVVIDAGHGGHDGGAEATDGTKESEISLQMVKRILEENTNGKIKIILTRATDQYQHPTLRADIAKDNHADLFVSLHAAASENKNDSGIELYIPTKDTLKHWKASYLFANTMANTIKSIDEAMKIQIKQRQVGIWVINASECPAVLVEMGFLTNDADLKKIKDENYQRKLARSILKGIEMYLQNEEAN